MKHLLLLSIALSASLAAIPAAHAVTLHHDDLVGIAAEGIIRIDGQTGSREVISPGSGASDVAVAYGGQTIYTVSGDSLYEIDPATGSQQLVSSDFNGAQGVSVNRAGQVFVLDYDPTGPVGSNRPRISEVDPVAGTASTLFVSSLSTPSGGDGSSWGALDLELSSDSMLAVLGSGGSGSTNPFGAAGYGGLVGYDLDTSTETLLLSQDDLGIQFWGEGLHGLGVLPDGTLLASSDYYWGGIALAHDPASSDSEVYGGSWDRVYDEDGSIVALLYRIDVAATTDGRIFLSHSSAIGWDGEPVPPGANGVHLLQCASPAGPSCTLRTKLVDGAAFSPGSFVTELQAVVIPEPSTAVLIGLGLAGLGAVRRRS